MRHGLLCQHLALCHGDRVKPLPPVAYMTCQHEQPESLRPQSEADMKAVAERIAHEVSHA